MIRRSGRRRHRAASACAVFAAIGVSTGLLGASLPQPAEAQPTDQNPLGGLVGGLLPLPSGSPPSSEPPSSEPPSSEQPPPSQEPEGSKPAPSEQPPPSGTPSQNPLQRLPLLSPPSSSAPAPQPEKPQPEQPSGGGLLQPLLPGGNQPGQQPGKPSGGGPLQPLLPGGNQPGQQPGGLLPGLPPAGGGLLPALHLPVGPPSDPRPGPGRAWTLTGSKMKLGGSRYDGFADQQVAGRTVRTLHFTVDRLEITDLVQRADLGNGRIVRTAAAPGSVSTVVNGPIELYTEDISGTLSAGGLPGVPLRLSPDTLGVPNLDLGFLRLPDLTLNNVVVNNAELNGGRLSIPGAHISLE